MIADEFEKIDVELIEARIKSLNHALEQFKNGQIVGLSDLRSEALVLIFNANGSLKEFGSCPASVRPCIEEVIRVLDAKDSSAMFRYFRNELQSFLDSFKGESQGVSQ